MDGERIALRPAVPADAPAVEAVLAASYGHHFPGAYAPEVLARAMPLMVRAQPALLASGRFHVAEAGGRIVGCGGWSPGAPGADSGIADGAVAHVRHVAVHPAHSRRGIGRILFEGCAAQAEAEGLRRWECWSSLPAEAFYAALGFVARGRIAVPLGGASFPAVRMTRDTAGAREPA